MNFNQIADATRKKISKGIGVSFIYEGALSEFQDQLNMANPPGWQHFDLNEAIDATGAIVNLYEEFKQVLQFRGMAMTRGEEVYDEMIWAELTKILSAFREVFIENFQIELPKARVVSLVTEMVEAGFLEECYDDSGVLCVKPKEPLYDLKIKIIKAPEGPAPKAFRQMAVGLVLPARRISNADLLKGYDFYYLVPKKEFIEALHQVSQEAADWLDDYFREKLSLIFHVNEVVEIIV
jgi:hypothetical protein